MMTNATAHIKVGVKATLISICIALVSLQAKFWVANFFGMTSFLITTAVILISVAVLSLDLVRDARELSLPGALLSSTLGGWVYVYPRLTVEDFGLWVDRVFYLIQYTLVDLF